ncbi:hypothetical protein PIB30_034455 [Stylosanthes scabra]|uniref:Zinc finger GRF-type domain-containing protein n=1 Tax=Stylosanthes scabra TaxID=79078 RepID=A0ABU6TDI5_9FABA|nr:hypothetical protein [Stylosanthes scabra]
MQVNISQESGCSSKSRSHSSWARSPNCDGGRKVPQWCGCGLRPVLRWSTTKMNPDRSFHGCPNYNASGQRWCGLFVWADGKDNEGMVGA